MVVITTEVNVRLLTLDGFMAQTTYRAIQKLSNTGLPAPFIVHLVLTLIGAAEGGNKLSPLW